MKNLILPCRITHNSFIKGILLNFVTNFSCKIYPDQEPFEGVDLQPRVVLSFDVESYSL